MELDPKVYCRCRLCAELKETGKLLDLQQIVPNLMRLNQPFFTLQDTSLPQKVCLICVQTLAVCVQFIDNLEKAQRTLINIFPSNRGNDYPPVSSETFLKIELPPNNLQILVKKEKEKRPQSITKQKKNTSKNNPKIKLKQSTKTKFCADADTEYTNKDSGETFAQEELVPNEILIKEDNGRENKSQTISKQKTGTSKNSSEKSWSDTRLEDNNDSGLLDKVKSWADLQWACSLCDLTFLSRAHLVEHSMNTHNNCTAYKCPAAPTCAKKFMKLESYIYHVEKLHCTKLQLSCHICGQAFESLLAFAIHDETHLPEPYSCVGCSLSFATKEDLYTHEISYYQYEPAPSYYEKCEKLKLKPMCNICNKKFDLRNQLKRHLKNSHQPKPIVCEQCGKAFFTEIALSNHMLLHTEKKEHQCSLCPETFKFPTYLKTHMMWHKGEKNFSCAECGKCFLRKRQLKTHIVIHSGNFPFKCNHCDKSFRVKSQLKSHLLQHTGFKPYKCGDCNREFTSWSNYNKHMVRIHGTDTSKTKRTPQGVVKIARSGKLP